MAVSKNNLIWVVTYLVFGFSRVYGYLKPETLKRYEAMCTKFGQDPYFDTEMIVGKPWRIYYTWNMKLENKCLDMVFKNATPRVCDNFSSLRWWDSNFVIQTFGINNFLKLFNIKNENLPILSFK